MAVRLLATVRASNGQELLSGWVCGFAEESARELISRGLAVEYVEGEAGVSSQAPAQEQEQAAPQVPEGFARVAGVVDGVEVQVAQQASGQAQTSRRRRG